MTSNFVAFFRTILRIFDLVVLRNSHYNNLLLALQKSRDQINNAANKSHDEKFYTTFVKYSEPIKALIPKSSSSELHQDLYVLSQLDFKENTKEVAYMLIISVEKFMLETRMEQNSFFYLSFVSNELYF